MSTDLRSALREAVSDPPPSGFDVGAVVQAGARRTRRRARTRIGAGALAVLVLLIAAAVASGVRRDPEPSPAEIVRLDLERATRVRLDELATTRTTWRDDGEEALGWDHLDGLTTDGLVLRSRTTGAGGRVELGLLDPGTGTTDWLPPAPVRQWEPRAVALTADRLVLASGGGNSLSVVVFDRSSRTWQRSTVRIPYGVELHVPPRLALGPDDRLYVGNTAEGQSGPMRWWSAPLTSGGTARSEASLEGLALAWADGTRVTADPDGRVIVTTPEGERVISEHRPDGCERLADFPHAPATVALAGDRPVVTYWCDSGAAEHANLVTMIYDPDGSRAVRVDGASVLAADDRHVLLSGSTDDGEEVPHPGNASTYLVDPGALMVSRIGLGPHEAQVGLAAGMVLWNEPGPIDDQDVYDVVWKVGRLG